LQSWDSDVFVLDATAFYQGFQLRANRKCITTELIVEEVSHLKKDLCPMNFLIEAQKISVIRPKEETVSYTRSVAAKIGDSKISPSDVSVIALAIDYGGTVVSDDHRVCNLASILSIPCLKLSNMGIKTVRKWTKYCRVCSKKHSYYENVCSICGNPLRVKYRDKKIADKHISINH
jgi:endoribonuclease Nob1